MPYPTFNRVDSVKSSPMYDNVWIPYESLWKRKPQNYVSGLSGS